MSGLSTAAQRHVTRQEWDGSGTNECISTVMVDSRLDGYWLDLRKRFPE